MKDQIHDVLTTPWVAAALGAVLSLKALPGAGMGEKLLNVGAGFAIAAYAGPALVEHMGWASPRLAALAIFGCGASGLVVFNGVMEALKRTDFGAWVMSWLPKKKGE